MAKKIDKDEKQIEEKLSKGSWVMAANVKGVGLVGEPVNQATFDNAELLKELKHNKLIKFVKE